MSDIAWQVAGELIKKHCTVALAESCTGGWIAAQLVEYPGISASLLEGVVVYANEAKLRLGVKPETLQKYGAVSHQTARELALCVRQRAGADVGIGVTGIAGPGGGSREKPVGLVYIALAEKDGIQVDKCQFGGDRQQVRQAAVEHALGMLGHYLEEIG